MTEINSQLQMKHNEVVKLQEDKQTLSESSSQLKAINKNLEAQNERLIQAQKVQVIILM